MGGAVELLCAFQQFGQFPWLNSRVAQCNVMHTNSRLMIIECWSNWHGYAKLMDNLNRNYIPYKY